MLTTCLGDSALRQLLQDDAPHGDLTTALLGIGGKPGRIVFTARGPMRVCGSEEAVRLFQLAGAAARLKLGSGRFAPAGAELLSARGSAQALHLAWKTAQTLMEYASGIASSAAAMVDALHAAGHGIPVACTRKSFPGTKAMAVKAVQAGGAVMHRLGLSETLLVFAEHRAFLERPLADHLRELAQRSPERKRVAEVASIDEAIALASAGCDVLQLERFTPADVARCKARVARMTPAPLLAAAGGVTVENVVAYADAGADLIVTSAPYFARPLDIQVVIEAL